MKKPPDAMRIELGSQKLVPNIIPVDYESQLLRAFTIEQSSILGRHLGSTEALSG